MRIPQTYIDKINSRSKVRYIVGLFVRFIYYCHYGLIRTVARSRGAKIGRDCIIPIKLAIKANSNLCVGDNTIVETSKLDLRGSKIVICDNVIINKQCEIIRVSHFIDDDNSFSTRYYDDLVSRCAFV